MIVITISIIEQFSRYEMEITMTLYQIMESAFNEIGKYGFLDGLFSISNIKQLRDYAKATERTLRLIVRPTTKVAKTVRKAGWVIEKLW